MRKLAFSFLRDSSVRRNKLLLVTLLITPALSSADSMRCGKWVVNEQSSVAEIAEKCGEPQEKEITEQDVLAKNNAGYPVKLGVQVTERWYYKPTPGKLTMLVTVVDGKVKSIARAE
jgi:hypothetical protein